MNPKMIHLSELADPELEGKEVTAGVVIAGIGDGYGVPLSCYFPCIGRRRVY